MNKQERGYVHGGGYTYVQGQRHFNMHDIPVSAMALG